MGPRHTGNYNPQQPGEAERWGLTSHVGAGPGRAGSRCGGGGGSEDRGLLFGAAAGPRIGEAGGLPLLARSRPPLAGVGPPRQAGPGPRRRRPPLARPAGPRGGTGPASARPRAISGSQLLPSAPDQRLPFAPQADAMKIKDARNPVRWGFWVRRWESTSGRVWKAPARRPASETGFLPPAPRAGWGRRDVFSTRFQALFPSP